MFTLKLIFLSSILAVALAADAADAADAPVPSFRCWDDGGPAAKCKDFIDSFCGDVNRAELLKGETHSRCFVLADGNRCDMMAFNDMTQKGTPDLNDCKSRAGAITTECHGGGVARSARDAFTYTVDHNSGGCYSQR